MAEAFRASGDIFLVSTLVVVHYVVVCRECHSICTAELRARTRTYGEVEFE